MVRVTDHASRRDKILSATIDAYIQTAEPISSEAICQRFDFGLSSATIRNVMAELEKMGFLTHPHTSAGRVPTERGYRYYIDFLMSEEDLPIEEKKAIEKEYACKFKELEQILEKTSEILSLVTHYTGIVSSLDWQDKFYYKGTPFVLELPEFRNNLDRIRHLLNVLEERHKLLEIINRQTQRSKEVYIGQELECEEMRDCSLVVSTYQSKGYPKGRLAVLGPTRMKYQRVIPALEYLSFTLSQILSEI